jgi:putative membrane-bound dehydrogenase-like protein
MNCSWLRAAASLFATVGIAGGNLYAQGFAAEEAARRMTVSEGFRVSVVAAEPLVQQPVAIEFDDRGRLWVIQYLQYPNPEGLKRVRVDRYSRTLYDRVPAPPPHGPKGADRITILEDSDGDGRADRSHDFVSGLNLTTGLAFGHGGVYVLNVPYLLFYPDRDRDDVPDGDPEVLLKGFGMEDAHSVANSLCWGPDGWLYGCQGSTVTANIRGIEFQQGVWRFHPLSKRFELFCEGGGNSWGLDFDRHGHLIYSTNFGGYIALHAMQGAYLVKSFGKHGALHNPFAFGYFDHMPHRNFHGGHVTVGGIIYQEDSFPEQYRGKYIAADLLGHGVYYNTLSRRGTTFASEFAGELVAANDTWFAPCDVTPGPDGALYVADWHDKRTAHPDPDAEWDRSNGRIFRIQAIAAKPAAHIDLNSFSSDQLVDTLGASSAWKVRRARRILAERRDPAVIPRLRQIVLGSSDSQLALESLWAVHVNGGFDEDFAAKCLQHRYENIRWWTVRLLGDEGKVSSETARQLIGMASSEGNGDVRAQLACTAKRLPAADALDIVWELLAHEQDIDDPYLPLLLWWAVERHSLEATDELLDWFAVPAAWDKSLAGQVILSRLIKRLAAEGTAESLEACARLLSAAPDSDRQRQLLASLDEGLQLIGSDRSFTVPLGALYTRFAVDAGSDAEARKQAVPVPAALVSLLEQLWDDTTQDAVIIRLAMRLGSSTAFDRAMQLSNDKNVPVSTRVAMLGLLGGLGTRDCVMLLLRLIGGDEPEPVKEAAITALAAFGGDEIASTSLAGYSSLSGPLRARLRTLLFGRKNWAMELLERIDRGEIPAAEVQPDELRTVALHDDVQLNSLVRKHWGEIRAGTPEEKLAVMRRFNNDLRAGKGNRESGRQLFEKHCGICHQFNGRGKKIGPDLTHANRKDREYLLASLVDPSAQIRKEFLSYVLLTTDGRVVTGLIAEQTPNSVTILGEKDQRTTIPRSQIEELKESPVSLMPEDVLKPLTPQQLRDLFDHLQNSEAATPKK